MVIIIVGIWYLNHMAYVLNNGEIRRVFPTFCLIIIADYFLIDPIKMLFLYYKK